MLGYVLALVLCLGGLAGLVLVLPGAIRAWRVVPLYYNLARSALPLLTLAYFGPALFGYNLFGQNPWLSFGLLFLLFLVLLGIIVYLYREPGATHRREQAAQPAVLAQPRLEPPAIEIRPATEADLPGAGRIFAEVFHQSFDLDFGPDRRRNGRMLGELLKIKQPEVWVAVLPDSGQVVGAIWLDLAGRNTLPVTFGRSWPVLKQYLNPLYAAYFASLVMPNIMEVRGTPSMGYIQWLGVAPDWQGRGIGRLLVEQAVKLAQAAAKSELALHTERSNRRARHLYESGGFTNRGSFPLSPRVRYVKTL
jgi:ribosomal protein S18 acetylase RimI-like enzyme/cbb3-type cytochrome oxidase subunit 3